MSEFLPATKFLNVTRTVTGTTTVEDGDQVLNCDTTLSAVIINLKKIPANYWSTLSTLYVKDFSGNCATNNITIVAPTGYKINNQQSIVLNVNSVCVTIKIATNTDYNTSYNTQTITGGHVISDEGTALPQQPILDFVGGLVVATNGSGKTIVTINNNMAVKNTAYVMKNGNDSTGLVERFDKPFLTFAAAFTAIGVAFPARSNTDRVRVYCESGLYREDINLIKYVDLDLGDSVIDGVITDNNVDFGVSSFGDWTNVVYGKAQIKNTQTSGIRQGILLYKANTKLLVYCDSIISSKDDGVAFLNGRCRIYCNLIVSEDTTSTTKHAVELAQAADYATSLIEIIGADITNSSGSLSAPIGYNGGGALKQQSLSLINCRVKASNNNGALQSSCVQVGGVASNGQLNLYNTMLFSSNGNSINVNTANTLTLYTYLSNMANVITGGAGTLTVPIPNTIVVNASIEAGF